MADIAPTSQGIRPGVQTRPADLVARTRSRSRTSYFGLAMLAPAMLMLVAFFFAPVILTTIFSFTNMTSATGISGGAYVLTPNLLRDLVATGLDPETAEALGRQTVIVDEAGVQMARGAGIDARFVDDIEARLMGQRFPDSRSFERELKKLPNKPSRTRDLKLAVEPFSREILNTRFADRDQAASAIAGVVPDLDPAVTRDILDRAYTGWVWTTENFAKLVSQPETLRLIFNTTFYVGLTLSVFNVGLGLFLALSIFYMPKNIGSVFSVLWLLPRVTPVVLYTIMWKWFTWDDGFLPVLAAHFGLPAFNYMKGSVATAWATIVSVNGFIGASFGMILFSGALRAIPEQQLWASEVDGATRWQQIRRIILPQLRWPILFVTSYQSLSLLSSYEQIWLTTDGGPGNTTNVWALEAFRVALLNYTGNLQYGLGAAMALGLVVAGLAMSIFFLRLFRFKELIERPRIEL